MKRELAAIYHELNRRYTAGESTVALSDESLLLLREVARASAASGGSGAPVAVERVPDAPVQPVDPLEFARAMAAALGSEPAAESTAASPDTGEAAAVVTPSEPPAPPQINLPAGDKQTRWEALRELVLADAWCLSQVKPGKKIVLGVGDLDAQLFFCGEAPGADEEEQGEPFVGKAGDLLMKIIRAMGLSREQVYIGNVMNYRPPMPSTFGNRPPTTKEMAYCLPYLRAQLEIVQPKVIVALGKTAVDGLLGPESKRRMGDIRGKWMQLDGTDLMITYHPSYLLRDQSMPTKRKVWEDMLMVMERLQLPISDKQRGFFL